MVGLIVSLFFDNAVLIVNEIIVSLLKNVL